MGIGAVLLKGFVHYAAGELPRLAEVHLDGRVFAIAGLVSVLALLLFAPLPIVRACKADVQSTLRIDANSGTTRSSGFARRVLVIAEIALAFLLVVSSALLLENLWHLTNGQLGFAPERMVLMTIRVKGTRLAGAQRGAIISEVIDFASHIPGIETAAETECTPLTGGALFLTFSRADRPLPEAFHRGDGIHVCGTSPNYLRAAGLRLL